MDLTKNYLIAMSNSSCPPRLCKGRIEIREAVNSVATYIFFQYNPDSITRTLTSKYSKTSGDSVESFRIEGAPSEEITVDVEFDAIDQTFELNRPKNTKPKVKTEGEEEEEEEYEGISARLAALETLIFPSPELVEKNANLAKEGKMEIVPPTAPLTVFVFGDNRVLPVKITKYQITEEAYTTKLKPIRAKVTISMSVLTYTDVQSSHIAYSLYQTYHKSKDELAKMDIGENTK